MPSQTFKWKTHLVRHKQTMHGNEPPPPKKGKQRFPKANEEGMVEKDSS